MEMIDFERSSHRNVISYAGRTFTLFILLVLALVMGPTLASAQELAATLTGTVNANNNSSIREDGTMLRKRGDVRS